MFLEKVLPYNIMKGLFELGSDSLTCEKSGELIVIAPPKSPKFSVKVFDENITGYLGQDIYIT